MEPVANLLPTATNGQTPSTNKPSPSLPRSWVVAFSERMRQMFREAWTSKWSNSESYNQLLDDYAEALARLTPDEIRAGLESTLGRDYPPSPSEFVGIARAQKARAAHKPFKALPRPPRDLGTAKRQIALLRAALGAEDRNATPQKPRPRPEITDEEREAIRAAFSDLSTRPEIPLERSAPSE